jgi:putative heme iron utilization protein
VVLVTSAGEMASSPINLILLLAFILFQTAIGFVFIPFQQSLQRWHQQQRLSSSNSVLRAAVSAPPSHTTTTASTATSIPALNSEGIANVNPDLRPTTVDKARTITHVCSGGTLCTSSVMAGVEGFPFGSYVDYILDENGWPVLLLSDQSLHTQNLNKNPSVSLFCQLPRSQSSQMTAALSRVTIMGQVESVPADQLNALKLAYTIVHPYAEQLVDSNKFRFARIRPEKVYFSGGFGVQATWVDVETYQKAKPDVLAQDVPNVLSRVNIDKQGEILLICKHFLGLDQVENARIQAIDRLGIDLRVKSGDFTDEYRIGFRHPVNSAEDAKSEMVKLFQEAWEREQGFYFTEDLPPIKKYAEDILRSKK